MAGNSKLQTVSSGMMTIQNVTEIHQLVRKVFGWTNRLTHAHHDDDKDDDDDTKT
jgi:hypothetical protein